jgi:putative membrane protein
MTSPVQATLQSWSLPILLTVILIAASFFYLRGWRHLQVARGHAARMNILPAWHAGSFLLGIISIWIALGSPLAAFDEQLLTVHMIQHLLLMTIAPPLILLGAPVMPMLHGLPRRFVQSVLGPVLRWRPLQAAGHFLARPAVCWVAAAAVLIGWHVPAAFTLALQSELWHVAEHSSFLTAGFLFWWPVVQPWPSANHFKGASFAGSIARGAAVPDVTVVRFATSATFPAATIEPRIAIVPCGTGVGGGSGGDAASRWPILLYLFFATIPCDILSGFLAFSDRLAYPVYLAAPRMFGLSALEDPECAAALMWTCVTLVYLIPAMVLTVRLLGVRHARDERFAAAQLQVVAEPFQMIDAVVREGGSARAKE